MSKQLFDSVYEERRHCTKSVANDATLKSPEWTCKKRIGLVVWDGRRVVENALCAHDLSNGQGAEKS